MSSTGDQPLMSTSFDSDQLPDGLKWYTEPKTWKTKARNNKGLLAITDPKTDFWQKTYYEPLLVADNGHFLYLDVSQEKVVMETEFEIKSSDQFDQCGLMVRTDTLHWIKCGIEYVDGHPGLGCVVTNDFSDWSKQDWQGNRLCLRVYRQGNSYVVESKLPSDSNWNFIRIAHLDHAATATVQMGLYFCSPKSGGAEMYFPHFSMRPTKGHSHGAD